MVDWNEFAAIATGALAVFAAIAARYARLAALYAKRDIEVQLEASHDELEAAREATETAQAMAQRQIEVSQRQLEASYRPLLIDVVPTGPVSPNDPLASGLGHRIKVEFPGGHSDNFDPREIYVGLSGGRMNIAVPLRNVGNGVAVIVPNLIWVGGQRVIVPMEGTIVQSKLVPPGETTRVVCAPRLTQQEMADYPWVVILHVPYWDFAGGQLTIARVMLEQRFKETEWILRGIDQLVGDEAEDQMDKMRSRLLAPPSGAPIHQP
jgi:hypothetical protein